MWAVGANGVAAYDVTDPGHPRPVNGSDSHGALAPGNPYNDEAQLHGSLRPNAQRFKPESSASAERGNVLLVSEEGNDTDCTDSFQTWYVPHLSGFAEENPTSNSGSVTPLGLWSLQSADPATRPPVAQFCSVHWFDYHQAAFVVIATYGSGTRVLDIRDPRIIRQVAYHWDDDDQAIQSYWVPERNGAGRTTGRATRLVYTADAGGATAAGNLVIGGGIDIFRVTLPE